MKLFRSIALAATAAMCMLPAIAQESPIAAVSDSDSSVIAQARVPDAAPLHPITAEQKQKLVAIRDQFELDNAQKKAILHVSQRQLHGMLRADSVDKSAALALQSKINGLKADLSTSKLSMMLAARDVFTAEQRAEFKQMRHHRGWGHHGGKRHCGGGGGCGGRGGHHGGGWGGSHGGGQHSANETTLTPSVVGEAEIQATSGDQT